MQKQMLMHELGEIVMKNEKIWDCIVVGAGVSGLACASSLAKKDKSVLVLEKSPLLGGRTSSVFNKRAATVLDNGQHILMGCYQETKRFLKRIGSSQDVQFLEQEPIVIKGLEKQGVFSMGRGASSWNLLWAMIKFKAIPFFDRFKVIQVGKALKQEKTDHLRSKTVKSWLESLDQSQALLERFWEPLCLATLNQNMEQACAAEFAVVLKKTFLSSDPQANSIGLCTKGLSEIFGLPAKKFIESKQGKILNRSAVISFYKTREKIYEVETDKEIFLSKKLVLALPPDQLFFLARESRIKKLLDSLRYITNLKASPIVTIYVKLKKQEDKALFFAINDKQSAKMVGFWNSPLHWLFDRPSFIEEKGDQYISMVRSAADAWLDKKPSQIFSEVCKTLDTLYGIEFKSMVEHYSIRKEAKATWVLKNLRYKTNVKERTYDPDLYLCGDWLDIELPSTIEAAARSGQRVAKHILRHSKNK
ncbi:hydroxysqualene dehydroxylase HpnE [bacterium]|nr:hydroxysqualene dehydroxylase HpnE [bacterium]